MLLVSTPSAAAVVSHHTSAPSAATSVEAAFAGLPALISRGQIAELVGIRRTAVIALTKRDDFPAAIVVSSRCLRYDTAQVHAWLLARHAPRTVSPVAARARVHAQRQAPVRQEALPAGLVWTAA